METVAFDEAHESADAASAQGLLLERFRSTAAVDCTTAARLDVPGQRKCYTQTCSAVTVRCFIRADLIIDNSPCKFYACLRLLAIGSCGT